MRIHSRDGRREPPQYIWRPCQITGASIPGGKYRQAANGCALVRVVVCLSCPTPLCNTGPAVRRMIVPAHPRHYVGLVEY